MIDQIPPKPPKSFRIILDLTARVDRMDNTLITALKNQNENLDLRNISRQGLKTLFTEGRIQIKGQRAKPSSALAKGLTYVDILGF